MFGLGGVPGHLAGAFAEFLGLLGQHLHLGLDVVRLQFQHVLDISRLHQLLREVERGRDVVLGENDRLLGDILGTLAGALGLAFERADGAVGG